MVDRLRAEAHVGPGSAGRKVTAVIESSDREADSDRTPLPDEEHYKPDDET
jgi:cytochrome c oxidase subunit 1